MTYTDLRNQTSRLEQERQILLREKKELENKVKDCSMKARDKEIELNNLHDKYYKLCNTKRSS